MNSGENGCERMVNMKINGNEYEMSQGKNIFRNDANFQISTKIYKNNYIIVPVYPRNIILFGSDVLKTQINHKKSEK